MADQTEEAVEYTALFETDAAGNARGKPIPWSVRRTDGKPVGVVNLIEQNIWWKDAAGNWLLIAELKISHATNLVRWLELRADTIHFQYGLGMCGFAPQGEMALDAFDGAMEELAEEPPLDWLRSTRLYKAVLARSLATSEVHESGLPARFRELRHSL